MMGGPAKACASRINVAVKDAMSSVPHTSKTHTSSRRPVPEVTVKGRAGALDTKCPGPRPRA